MLLFCWNYHRPILETIAKIPQLMCMFSLTKLFHFKMEESSNTREWGTWREKKLGSVAEPETDYFLPAMFRFDLPAQRCETRWLIFINTAHLFSLIPPNVPPTIGKTIMTSWVLTLLWTIYLYPLDSCINPSRRRFLSPHMMIEFFIDDGMNTIYSVSK